MGREPGESSPEWFRKLADDLGLLPNPLALITGTFRKTPPNQRGSADGLRAGYEVGPPTSSIRAAAHSTRSPEVAADGARAEGEFVDAFGEDVGDVVGAFEHAVDEQGTGVARNAAVLSPHRLGDDHID